MTIFSYYTTKLGIDPDALAIFNRMPNELLAIEKEIIEDWVVASKASGNFGKYDYFYGFFLSDRDNALTDWITGKTATAVNSPSHTANQGFSFNGSTQYIDSNINLATDFNNYSLNSAEFGGYIYENLGTTVDVPFGVRDDNSSGEPRTQMFQLNGIFWRVNDVNGITYNADNLFQNLNRYSGVRVSSTRSRLYKNGVLVEITNANSLSVPNINLYVGGNNRNNTLVNPFTGTVSHFYTAGGNFDQSALNTELQILENNLIS